MKKLALLNLFAALVFAGSVRADYTVESDTFTSNPGSLQNRPVENPQFAGDTYDIGNTPSGGTTAGGGFLSFTSGFAKASAPFDASNITGSYSLNYTLSFNPGTDGGLFFYGGIGNSTASVHAGFPDYNDALAFQFNLSPNQDVSGTSFTLYGGIGTSSTSLHTTITRASTAVDYVANLSIKVNTNTNVDTFYVDGTSIGTVNYTGTIGNAYFKEQGDTAGTSGDTGIQVSNFSITAPEPSTWAMLLGGLGVLALVARQRRAKI